MMNDSPQSSSTPNSPGQGASAPDTASSAGPYRLDAQLREALSAPDGVAERLVLQALRPDADGAPSTFPYPGRRGRPWTVAAAAALCLAMLWLASPIWRPSHAPPETSVQLAESESVPTEEIPSSTTARRHLRLSNTGDVVQLTAPSGNTLLIVASAPTSRR